MSEYTKAELEDAKKDPFADLHIHSFYSDGTMSPEEIVKAAVESGVGTLAIADHNILDGSLLLRGLCRRNGINYIPAVEIDAVEGETDFHILAYGFDINNVPFNEFVKHARFSLDEMSVKLVELMGFPLEDYMNYTYDRSLGGWKALHYFLEKGFTSSLKEGIKFYSEYGVTYDKAGYSTIAATAYRIKTAGGYSVLAHPGELIDSSDINQFKAELRRIVSLGVDGIECYYPSHSEAVTQACLEVCEEYDLLVTAGSDCHGIFTKTKINEMSITMDKLKGIEKCISKE
ncbi:MAG: PHP domain-containing protein [Oscillospiraceae bacterium]|nr:PHP domain-containing protein [Oscillospiraceae bacterium]